MAPSAPAGKKIVRGSGYTFRVLVTNLALPPEEIWRDYNHGADMKNRLAELQHDLAAARCCICAPPGPARSSASRCCKTSWPRSCNFAKVASETSHLNPKSARQAP